MRCKGVLGLILGWLAAVLFVAAFLKAVAMSRGEGRVLEGGLVVLESMLGAWLVLSRRPSWAAFAAALLFAGFVAHNTVRLTEEPPFRSCGCFGAWQVPLVGVMVLDVVCLGGATWVALVAGGDVDVRRLPRFGLCAGLVAAALAFAWPMPQVAVRREVMLGIGRPHESRLVTVPVRAASDQGAALIGAHCSRGVRVVKGLPARVSVKEPAVVVFRVHWPGVRGRWVLQAELLTGRGDRVPVLFRGETCDDVRVEVCDEEGGP